MLRTDNQGQDATTEVILVNGADLTPEPIRWLWPDWLALGKFHILAGAPGQGKTTIALKFAATVTSGGRWPDGSQTGVGNVLIWSGEDDPADTLVPRLIASGANIANCYFIDGTSVNGEVRTFDPARDMPQLEEKAMEIGNVKLLIVDPIVSAVRGDSHNNTEVRRALQPFVDLAASLGVGILGISHFSKGGAGGDPATRVVGSIAFTAVARVVLVAAKVSLEDGNDRRVLARAKSNIGSDKDGFEYNIQQSEPLPGIEASHVVWGARVEGSARDLLAEPEGGEALRSPALTQAQDFLVVLLKEGPCPTTYVVEQAKAAGISWRTVRRASEVLEVEKKKIIDKWYWDIPKLSKELAHGVQRCSDGQDGQVERIESTSTSCASEHVSSDATDTGGSEVF